MTQRIVVLGASNAFHEVLGIVSAINKFGDQLAVIGVLDDDPDLAGKEVAGVPVLGTLGLARQLDNVSFVYAIGSLTTQSLRRSILEKLGLEPERFINLIHPTAEVDETAEIGHGCILHKGVSLGPNSKIGNFVVIAINSALGPNVIVEDYALITSFVLLLTGSLLGEACYIGSMTCVLEGKEIGSGARVGVGSIVNRSVPSGALAIGNPVKIIGRNPR